MSAGLVLIAGGSASGKTTLARALHAALAESAILAQDSFYVCETMRRRGPDGQLDFDVPDAVDFPAFRGALAALQKGLAAEIPVYDFRTHRRTGQVRVAPTSGLLIAEGTLILHDPAIRALTTHTIFVSADADLRTRRRLKRDCEERGREQSDVLRQLRDQVFPAHAAYVEPCRAFAQIIVEANALEADLAGEVDRLIARLAG